MDGNAFESTGTGSVLDLPALATLAPQEDYLEIDAYAGGETLIPALTSITNTLPGLSDFEINADSAGSTIDLSSLATINVNPGSLSVTNGGTVLDGKLTSAKGLKVSLDGTGTVATAQISGFSGGSLTVTGPNQSIPGLTDFTSSTVNVNGGTLTLPGLTDFANGTANLSGGSLSLPALASAQGASFTVTMGTTLTFSSATDFAGSGTSVTLMPLATLTIGTNVFTLPTSGTGVTVDVPTLAVGLTVELSATNQTYSGGTAINVAAGDDVAFTAGTFTGGVAFNVGQGGTVDLTGGQTVDYGGLLSGTGAGTVVLSGGAFYPTVGGVTLSFPGTMFQWTGGGMELSVGDVTNMGTINLSGPNETEIYADGTLFDYGSIVQSGSGNFTLHGDGVTLTTLNIEAGGSYLFESDSGIDIPEFTYETQIINDGTIEKTAGTGTTNLQVAGPLTNAGTIQVDSGTLDLEPTSVSEVSGTTLTGGTWTAQNGATLDFPSGTVITDNAATVSLAGPARRSPVSINWLRTTES